VIVGAGGFGREVYDLVTTLNRVHPTFDVMGFLDDAIGPSDVRVDRLDATVLGGFDELETTDAEYALGLGSPVMRAQLAERASRADGSQPRSCIPIPRSASIPSSPPGAS
jgi:hypothetical protein